MSNFEFLRSHHATLADLPRRAELYCHTDPNTALLKIRQFGEALALWATMRIGSDTRELDQVRRIHELRDRGILNREVADDFHVLRKMGNSANHEFKGTSGEAIDMLVRARRLAVWFHRTFGDRGFKPGAFVRPEPPEDRAAALEAQVAELQKELELDRRRFEEELARESKKARETSPEEVRETIARGFQVAEELPEDEAQTRGRIDAQLRDAGWRADTKTLRWSAGARPQKGTSQAIAEVPTEDGIADYVLFHGLVPLAVVEAKKSRKNAAGAIEQAKRYSRAFALPPECDDPGGPWGNFRIPFLFATNGRPFLRQLREESGIWSLDARRPTHHPRPLDGWPTPDGLHERLAQDEAAADQELAAESADTLPLRYYQRDAIRDVETAIAEGRREMLVAMATGTGKTRTAICLVYRLIKAKRFRRVLFLVDRTALGVQAGDAFDHVELESLKTFTDVYDVKKLGDVSPDKDTRLHIATIQAMVKRLLFSEEPPPVDAYDCLVVDECHRGYNLDREMSDTELEFRDEEDYRSKYRLVLDHFDAVKIGLTATPALHTTQIFGEPVTSYSYRQAVIDGYLVDHEPPIRLGTKLGEEGIRWEVGEPVQVYDTGSQQLDLFHTPDEIHLEIESFNRTVRTESFNRVITEELARHVDPSLPGKTLVFCVDESHAVLVTDLLKRAFTERYGEVEDDAVMKITGQTDRVLEKIRFFKNERLPSVVVTVDLLTTGVDVRPIVNLVFLRRVKSRILYEQMKGRATRLCEDLGGGEVKEVFRIYDAVKLYDALEQVTDMKPVVQDPKVTFQTLVDQVVLLRHEGARREALDQLVAKLRRKHRQIERFCAGEVETLSGMAVGELIDTLRRMTVEEAARFLDGCPDLPRLLDRRLPRAGQKVFVSEHEDELVSVERGWGEARRPEDFLEEFGRYLAEHRNEIPALVVVTQRPRKLTRQALKELKLALDEAGYSETGLRVAWREATNQDVAASIIGFIRQRALGEPLVPYGERVDRALRRILESRAWTPPQRQWLERIGKQLKVETVVDREALDSGPFADQGGFRRIDKVFDGRLLEVLGDLQEEVWRESA